MLRGNMTAGPGVKAFPHRCSLDSCCVAASFSLKQTMNTYVYMRGDRLRPLHNHFWEDASQKMILMLISHAPPTSSATYCTEWQATFTHTHTHNFFSHVRLYKRFVVGCANPSTNALKGTRRGGIFEMINALDSSENLKPRIWHVHVSYGMDNEGKLHD